MYYFAYGSNMDKLDLEKWCAKNNRPKISFSNVTKCKLLNYKLVFNMFSKRRNGGVANIMFTPGHNVHGLLTEINSEVLDTIRMKEGYFGKENGKKNYYEETKVNVEKENGEQVKDVITFKVVKNREEAIHHPPTKYYYGLIYKNAIKYSFPYEYIRYLRSITVK